MHIICSNFKICVSSSSVFEPGFYSVECHLLGLVYLSLW